MNKPRLWTKPFPWKAVLCASVILLCIPAPDAHAQNLDNVSSQNLVNQMKAKLGDGDLYGAVPLLLEFKKRAKDGEFKSSRLDKIDYFIALGYMKGFTEKRDKNLLKKAAERFEHYIKEYPSGSDIHYVLLNKVDCHRGTGDFKGAIKTLNLLLARPHVNRLRLKERMDSMEKLVQAYYFEQMWEAGLPWFARFLDLTPDKEKKTMAAAAMVEAYVKKEQFDKIDALLPYLNTNTKYRFDPRLNYQFLQAGDHLASKERYHKASLFYSLTMTPKEIVEAYKSLLKEVIPKLKYYKDRQKRFKKNFPRNEEDILNNLQLEHDTIKRKHDRVAEMLKNPDNDYTKDLRWRKATNYQAMGRDWEAYWGFMGLVTDYPKVDKDRRESYMYATFVQAEKIKKRDAAFEIARRYLDNPEFKKYAYEVGLRLAAMYKDDAEKKKLEAESAETPPEAEAFTRESNESFDAMWKLCTMLIDKKPEDQLASHVVYMMGSGWIARGEEKFPELAETFEKLLAKDYGAEKPDMMQGLYYWSALALLYMQEYEKAKANFDTVVGDYPESDYFEDSMFRRGVCAKGMGEWETARQHLSMFKEKYPKSKMRGEAEVFLGDIASAEEKPDQAIIHYKTVVFGTEEGPITQDYKFIDYAVFETGALLEARKTRESYTAAKEIYEKYIEAHPEGDHSKALLEIARLLELMDDPREMFKRYYSTILEYGNNRNGLGVDDTLRKYYDKYYTYFGRFNDTYQFLNKLHTDAAHRQEVLSNRDKLFLSINDYPKIDKEVKEKFTFDAAYRQELIENTAPLKETLDDFKSRLDGLPAKPPEETFNALLKESMGNGRDTLKYRLMMFLDNIYKKKGSSLQDELGIRLPPFFDIPDFQKASPSTLLWMAEYNLENKSTVATQKAKVALVSIVKSFPGTPDGELPALMLLGKLEAQNAAGTSDAKAKKNSYLQAYGYYKRAHEFFPASDRAKYAAVSQADMLRKLGDYTKAILLFQEITRVPQWRGPVHAEATLKLGLCYYEQQDIDRAFPYFEATYVRYARYSSWAAQGYLYHARCLKKMNKLSEATAVIQTAFKNPQIRKTEWFDELNQEI